MSCFALGAGDKDPFFRERQAGLDPTSLGLCFLSYDVSIKGFFPLRSDGEEVGTNGEA
jgi:hypothetical protein